jgi:hypothetical protein
VSAALKAGWGKALGLLAGLNLLFFALRRLGILTVWFQQRRSAAGVLVARMDPATQVCLVWAVVGAACLLGLPLALRAAGYLPARKRAADHAVDAALAVAAGFALWQVACLVSVLARRWAYPYELEWGEGLHLDVIRRILDHKTYYTAPSLEWIPLMYTPLYVYLGAWWAKWWGLSFASIRLLSIGATAGTVLVLAALVWRETRDRWASFFSAALFLATFKIAGAWFDIVRNDMVFVFFTLAGFYLVRGARGRLGVVAGAAVYALGFWTKQTALLPILASGLALLWVDRKLFWPYLLACVLFLAVPAALAQAATSGWFGYYTFGQLRSDLVKEAVTGFWTADLVKPLFLACAIGLAGAGFLARRDRAAAVHVFLFCLAMVAGAYGSRIRSGGYDNVLIPAYVSVAIFFGLGVAALAASSARIGWRGPLTGTLLGLAMIWQFARLYYPPSAQIPTAGDRAYWDSFVAKLRTLPGEVYVPYTGFVPTLAGKETYASILSVRVVIKRAASNLQAERAMEAEFFKTLGGRRFPSIILDAPRMMFCFEDALDANYGSEPWQGGEGGYPVTGWRIRPEKIYRPKQDSSPSKVLSHA